MRGIVDSGVKQCGFIALVTLNRRFDIKNAATLLQAVLEVVVPPALKKGWGYCVGDSQMGGKIVVSEKQVQ